MIYVIFYFLVVLVNVIPAFAPPTWTVLVFFLNYYDLNIYVAILVAVAASTTGRFLLLIYAGALADKVFNKWEKDNLEYLGKRIGSTYWKSFVFIFLYCLSPISSDPLFVAAGIAKIKKLPLLLGFVCGRLINYSILAFSSRFVLQGIGNLMEGGLSMKNILFSLFGVLIILIMVFTDWKEMLLNKKLKINFKIWRWDVPKSV